MSYKTLDIPDAPPQRRKQQRRFHIGFVVREAANCGVLDNGRRGNRTRSKSITVDASTLEEAITEQNLKHLLAVVRASFMSQDRRTTTNPRVSVPRRIAPPKAPPYKDILAAKAERKRAAEAMRELELAAHATDLIRRETNATRHNTPPVRPQVPVARRTPAVVPPLRPAPPTPKRVDRGPVEPAPRVTSFTRRAPAPPLAPPPPRNAVYSRVAHAAVAAAVAGVKHDHTSWCVTDHQEARRHHDVPRAPLPPRRPPPPTRRPDLEFDSEHFQLTPLNFADCR